MPYSPPPQMGQPMMPQRQMGPPPQMRQPMMPQRPMGPMGPPPMMPQGPMGPPPQQGSQPPMQPPGPPPPMDPPPKPDPPKKKKGFFGKMMTPFTAPVKAVSSVAKKGAGLAGKAVKGVGGIAAKVAPAVGSVAGMVGQAATVGSMFLGPELLPIAGIADAVSTGAGIAGSVGQMVSGGPQQQSYMILTQSGE